MCSTLAAATSFSLAHVNLRAVLPISPHAFLAPWNSLICVFRVDVCVTRSESMCRHTCAHQRERHNRSIVWKHLPNRFCFLIRVLVYPFCRRVSQKHCKHGVVTYFDKFWLKVPPMWMFFFFVVLVIAPETEPFFNWIPMFVRYFSTQASQFLPKRTFLFVCCALRTALKMYVDEASIYASDQTVNPKRKQKAMKT